jgi:hypothetical protein
MSKSGKLHGFDLVDTTTRSRSKVHYKIIVGCEVDEILVTGKAFDLPNNRARIFPNLVDS